MRKIVATTLALAGAMLTGAAAPPARPALLPVSDADTRPILGGCESWFMQGQAGLLFANGRDFMIRTARGTAGLHVCRMTDAQNEDFGSGPTQVSCGGLKLSVRPTGKATGHGEADSVDYPALMTVSDGKATRTLRGRYGTAC